MSSEVRAFFCGDPVGEGTMIVSRGLMCSILPRVFNPPELVIVDLLPET